MMCEERSLSLSLFVVFLAHSVQKNDKIFFTEKERDDGTELDDAVLFAENDDALLCLFFPCCAT